VVILAVSEPTHCGPTVKEDKGCKRKGRRISERCVDCHLETCLEETPGGIGTLQAERIREMVAGLRQLEWPVGKIADRLRLHPRTVFRILEGS
jgi:hypothetical protein